MAFALQMIKPVIHQVIAIRLPYKGQPFMAGEGYKINPVWFCYFSFYWQWLNKIIPFGDDGECHKANSHGHPTHRLQRFTGSKTRQGSKFLQFRMA